MPPTGRRLTGMTITAVSNHRGVDCYPGVGEPPSKLIREVSWHGRIRADAGSERFLMGIEDKAHGDNRLTEHRRARDEKSIPQPALPNQTARPRGLGGRGRSQVDQGGSSVLGLRLAGTDPHQPSPNTRFGTARGLPWGL